MKYNPLTPFQKLLLSGKAKLPKRVKETKDEKKRTH